MFKIISDWLNDQKQKLEQQRIRANALSKESDCPRCGAKADKIVQGDTFWYSCWNCNEEFGQSWKQSHD